MNILAIDTSSEYLSLALQYNETQSFILEHVANKQSNYIIPKIDELLTQNKITIKDIDVIAYNQGPGSFTGLRIGLSVALGLSLGANTKIVPIPAFAIYAQNIKQMTKAENILIGIDARLNQIYLAGINLRTFQYFMEPQVIDPGMIHVDQANIVCTGGGFKVYHNLLPHQIQDLCYINNNYPNALNMLELINNNHYTPCAILDADLLYLRNKIALTTKEQKLLQNQQKTNIL